MTHTQIVDALAALLDKIVHGEPVEPTLIDDALEAVRLLNEVGFQ